MNTPAAQQVRLTREARSEVGSEGVVVGELEESGETRIRVEP